MKKPLLVAAGVCAAVAIISGVYLAQRPTEQYAVFLDPFKDKQPLVTNTHVTVQNVGRDPLTNVKVDYGGGYSDKIPVLNPGEKMILSPPSGNDPQQVTVTSDQGINVTKPYRTPINMPGMMGS